MVLQKTIEIETPPANALVKIVGDSGLEQTKAQYILEKFQDHFKIAADWESKAKTIVVTSEAQTAEMKMAREGRLFLKQKRIEIEKSRKELKEQSLREGKAIDGIANVLKALIEPTEEYLERQEKFVELRIEKEKNELMRKRFAQLQPYGEDLSAYDFGNMSTEQFNRLAESMESAKQAAETAFKEAQELKLREAAEQQRIKEENAKLKAAQDEKDRELAKEREKLAAAEAAIKARAAAEDAEKKRIAAQERKAANAPDREKLEIFCKRIEMLEIEFKSEEAKEIWQWAQGKILEITRIIRDRAETL